MAREYRMRVGPITPIAPVRTPSKYVDATRLNSRRSAAVCSVPITTVKPGPSMYSSRMRSSRCLSSTILTSARNVTHRHAAGVLDGVVEQRGGPFDEDRILGVEVLEGRSGEAQRAGEHRIADGAFLFELRKHALAHG